VKKVVITVIAIAGVVALGIKGKSLLETRKSEVENTPLPRVAQVSIPVVKAKEGYLAQSKHYMAELLSEQSIQLSTKLAGYVTKIAVSEADVVKKGDTLVLLDSVEIRSNIASLRATKATQQSDKALAQRIYARNQKLYKIGGLAKEQLEASAVVLKAKSSLLESTIEKIAQLQNQLNYLEIKAPFDGVIDHVLLHKGDLAVAGKPIVSMSTPKQKLRFSYALSDLSFVKRGNGVFVEGKRVGEVISLYPSSANGLAQAEVALSQPLNYPLGSRFDVVVEQERVYGCLLPTNTLIHKREGTFIMVQHKNRFVPKAVEVKMQNEQQVLLERCPKAFVAYGNEVKLAQLPVYGQIHIIEKQ